jgi:hypothetical protein
MYVCDDHEDPIGNCNFSLHMYFLGFQRSTLPVMYDLLSSLSESPVFSSSGG